MLFTRFNLAILLKLALCFLMFVYVFSRFQILLNLLSRYHVDFVDNNNELIDNDNKI